MKKKFSQVIITVVTTITRTMDRLLIVVGQGQGAGTATQKTAKTCPYKDLEYRVWLLKRSLSWYGYKRMTN